MTRPQHEIDGYSAGASGYRHKCRCDECKASNRKYQRKHRANDDAPSAVQSAIIEIVKETVISAPVSEPVIIPPIREEPVTATPEEPITVIPEVSLTARDESIPYQILEAIDSSDTGDTVIYEDGGEGWKLEELALILPSMADVTCQIRRNKLYVNAIVAEIAEDAPTPMVMPASMTVTMPQRNTSYPAQPRNVPKVATATPARPRNVTRAAAPTVPGTPYRAPVSVNRTVNTQEPFSL
jgi:hypothetical protein